MTIQSAMARRWAASSAVPPGGGPEVTPQVRETIRDAVLAGPLAPAGLADDLCEGLFRQVTGGDLVERAVAGAGHVDVRRQVLTGPVTAQLVLGMCLFGDGYEAILDRLIPAVAAPLAPGADVPAPSALSLARARLGDEVMPAMFAASGVGLAAAGLPGVRAFGMLVTATDGTCWDLADSAAIAGEHATPAGGKHPQSRMVAVGACGTRHVLGAAIGSCTTSEQELNDQLPGTLMPGTLNTADRNFFSVRRWCTAAATGAHLVWRVKNGAKSLPAKIIRRLPGGSALVRLRESDGMLARRRRRHGDTTLVRLPDTIARLIEFGLAATGERGRTRLSRVRLLTTLPDVATYPAGQVAEVYAMRRQAELVFLRLKASLRGSGVVLRGQSPALARQELRACLITCNALRDLAVQAAALEGTGPDAISFTTVLRLTRDHVLPGQPCRHCGKRPADTTGARNSLVQAIAQAPRNRTGRRRTGPRTAKDRKTQPTQNVSYTINIIESDLPKVA